ncbi:C2H2-type domain-containing protein [Fusarium sp. LHS14.1]|nr:C2H2-type domain-containing protein [Fusarium sp. LHS14.1]
MSATEETTDPPEGYFVADCPNHAEISTLSCPYIGCDGFKRWHEGQYACGQCKAVFASSPPLERHGRDSGHAIEWYCDEEECEMAGTPFETYRIYLEHFRLSPAHQDDAESEEIIDALGNTDVVVPSQDQQDDNSPSQLVTSDIFACREPCCQRYGFNFRCISEYNRHANVSYHISAARLNQALVDIMQPGPALADEQEAMRNLRCNAPGCLKYGVTFSGFQGFFSHINGAEHRQAWTVVSGACFLDEHESPTLPGILFDAGGASGECANKTCPKYGTFFNSFSKLKQHAHSFAHATTEEDMDSADESSQEVWASSDLEGIEVTKDKAFWRCAHKGCKMFGSVYNHRSNARLHTTSFSHTSAEAFLGEVWVSSEFEGMEVKGMEVKGMALWKCVKRGSKRYGQTMTPSSNARTHANSVSHTEADPDVPMSPETPTTPFATPNSAPATALLTPMNIDTPVPATPLSPSAGRGSSAAMALITPTKTPTSLRMPPSRATVKLRRSSNTSSQVKRRQDDLERRNQELEDRVKRLEEQLARVLGPGSTQQATNGGVHEQANDDEGGNNEVEYLYQFVRSSFRPT